MDAVKTCAGCGNQVSEWAEYPGDAPMVLCLECDGSDEESERVKPMGTVKTEHTPGPWEATGNDKDGYAIHARTPAGVLVQVAEINGPYTPGMDRYAADARLIATAPELLAALILCEDALMVASPQYAGTLARTRAAIAKASG